MDAVDRASSTDPPDRFSPTRTGRISDFPYKFALRFRASLPFILRSRLAASGERCQAGERKGLIGRTTSNPRKTLMLSLCRQLRSVVRRPCRQPRRAKIRMVYRTAGEPLAGNRLCRRAKIATGASTVAPLWGTSLTPSGGMGNFPHKSAFDFCSVLSQIISRDVRVAATADWFLSCSVAARSKC
jgi:hypothetical protein